MSTILDHNPYFAYARYLGKENHRKVVPLIKNIISDIPSEFEGSNFCPRLGQFGSEVFILGDEHEVALGSLFLKKNPNSLYAIEQYETPDQAKSRFIATYGESYDLSDSPTETENPEESYQDDALLSLLAEDSSKAMYIRSFIESFVRGTRPNKAPCLTGHSGIAKSSIVYKVVEQLDEKSKGMSLEDIQNKSDDPDRWGYKLIEIRAGFLDKTDLMGFSSSVTVDGIEATADSPKKEFLLCSTDFVNSCRQFLISYPAKDITPEEQPLIDKMRYYAKTPVLFLDEVNRAPQSILSQLMIIINSHRLDRYNLDIAPKICAKNALLLSDLTELDTEKQALFKYLVDKSFDLATVGRFQDLYVSDQDESIILDTYDYLIEKFAGVPSAIRALEWAKKNEKLYSHKSIDQNGKFPTFRGWEDLCKYLKWVEENPPQKPLRRMAKALLGDTIDPTKFIGNPKNNDNFDDSNSTDSFIRHCIESGLTCQLLGRLNVAKTAKLAKYSKKNGGVVEFIDLMAEDRTTVNGAPKKKAFLSTVFDELTPKEHRRSGHNPDVDTSLSTNAKFMAWENSLRKEGSAIPVDTTIMLPKDSAVSKILSIKKRAAAGEKIKLILFFDEFNRAKETVQSSIFEAVSLKKFRGISLEDIDYSVVVAGNWQSIVSIESQGVHYKVTPVDTAMLHRGPSLFIEHLDAEDIKDFMLHLEENEPETFRMLDKLRKQDPGKLQQILNVLPSQDEDITEHTKIFGFREASQLGCNIKQFDVDLIAGLTSIDIKKIVSILDSSHYILTKMDPNRSMEPYFKYGEPLRPLYGKGKITLKDFTAKSIPILQDPATPKETVDGIITLLKFIEDEIFGSTVMSVIADNTPDHAKELVKQMVYEAFNDRTAARIATTIADDIFGTKEETARSIEKLVADWPADSLDTRLTQYLIYRLKESHEKIPLSKIVQVLEIYNASSAAKASAQIISVGATINKLMDYSDKIKRDFTKKIKVDLIELLSGKIDKDLSNVLKKHIDFDLQPSISPIKNYLFTVGYQYIGDKSIVPDLFTLNVRFEGRPGNQPDVRSIVFDDHTFKVDLKPVDGDKVNIEYTGEIGIYIINISVEAINKVTSQSNDSVIPKAAIDDPDLLVKKNLSSLMGVMKSIEVHGGSLEDVPELDTKDISKLKNTTVTVSQKVGKDITGHTALLFKRAFSSIEKLFS